MGWQMKPLRSSSRGKTIEEEWIRWSPAGNPAGGKSELRRAGCSVTQSPGDGKESATETYRPAKAG